MLGAAGSACVAESCTYPIDVFKTLLQLEKGTPRARGTLVLSQIRNLGPFFSLYSGLRAALTRQVCYSSTRMFLYEESLRSVKSMDSSGVYSAPLLAAFSGGIAQLITSPIDLCKVRMQSQPGVYPTMSSLFRQTIAIDGVGGLWKGALPNVKRAMLVNAGDIPTYSLVKYILTQYIGFEDAFPVHIACASMSGIVSASLSTPGDVLKTVVMSGNGGGRSMFRIMKDIAREEGIRGLYKGFIPNWARLAPWQLMFWVSFEQYRSVAGISGF